MIAEVFAWGDYVPGRIGPWDTPRRIDVGEEDVLRGCVLVSHMDCMGTGHYLGMPEEVRVCDGDFCVGCKGSGIEGVTT